MTTVRTDSAAKQLLELRLETVLGTTLTEFVQTRRQAHPRMSWRRIAIDIYASTGHDVSGQALSKWCPDLTDGEAETSTPVAS